MTAPQGVPIARIPSGQPLDLFSAVGNLLDAALRGAMLTPGNGRDVAATVVARDGQSVHDVIAELRHAAGVLAAAKPASATAAEPGDDPEDEPDEFDEPTTVSQLSRGETGWVASLGGGAQQAAAEMARQMLSAFAPAFEEHGDAVNYLSWDAVHPPTGQKYSLIVVRSNGLTPHEARQHAEQECERLRRLLAEHGIEVPEA